MTLTIHAKTGSSLNLAPLMTNNVKVVILDVDDTVYHHETGLHNAIKQKILRDANTNPHLKDLRQQWASEHKIGKDAIIKAPDLGWAFPMIVDQYRQKSLYELTHYLQHVYNVDYSVIPPQPKFVEDIRRLRALGIRIVLYSNGPFGKFDGKEMHVNRALNQIGFSAHDFAEDDVVDLLKTDREANKYLIRFFSMKHSDAMEVFRKPKPDAFVRMCKTLYIAPGPHVAYIDDSAQNLEAAASHGVLTIHTPTSMPNTKQRPASEKGFIPDYTVRSNAMDDTGKYLSPASAIIKEFAAWMPNPVAANSNHVMSKASGLELG